MKADLTVEPPEWMRESSTQKIMSVLNEEGQAATTLFVGGCIRNWILQKEVHDIDLATKLKPEEVIKKLEKESIKVIPTGIDHGTVTAVIDGKPFEITTLRRDIETDGRHAEVSYTQDWLEDARRRDFTMNSLLADNEGRIYDLLGQGIEDAKAQRVIFVGDPEKRIAEDYLRILRFFRFQAHYGQGEMDRAALESCRAAADKIDSLSRERVTQEFLQILSADKASEILQMMFDCNVLSGLVDKNYQPEILQKLSSLQEKYNAINVEARLFVVTGCHAHIFEERLRLSHVQKNFMLKLEMLATAALYADEKSLKKAIFYHGNDFVLQGYLLYLSQGEAEESDEMIDLLQNWRAPTCPVTGETLLAEGYKTGPELGQELTRRQEEWLEEVI